MRKHMISLVVVALAAAACSSGGGTSYSGSTGPTNTVDQNPAPTTPNTINANPGLAFNPTALTVTKGTIVTFNFGTVGHSVTFTTTGAPASIPVSSNTTVQVTFPTAGAFSFYCTVHSYMTGTITVQ
jgi:plastocyanin